jgi:hypothetical protein
LLTIGLKKGCNKERSFDIHYHIDFRGASFGKTRASGKMVSAKMVQAQEGRVEVVLPDGTRCDCVTDTHAIEFEFGGT